MTFHRNQAQFARARWRRAVLVPVWAFQTAVLLAIIGVFSSRLAATVRHFDAARGAGKVPTVELVWECTNVGFAVLCLVLTGLEAHRLLAETLTPFFLLASHIVKLTCAAAILALDIVVYTQRAEGNWSSVGLALDAALLAAMLALGIYAVVAFRRLLAFDDYHHYPAGNVKAFGFGSAYDDELELGRPGGSRTVGRTVNRTVSRTVDRNSLSGMGLVGNSAAMGSMASGDVYLRATPYNDLPTEYDPATAFSRNDGSARSRSHSAASTLHDRPADLGASRRTSYNHERDTQFDDYVRSAAAAGGVLSKDDIDQALGAELWGPSSAGTPPATSATAAASAVERSNSVVATGVVAARAVAAPQREAINRTVSWNVEHGLVPVAEERGAGTPTIAEEDEYGLDGGKGSEGSALLLGHERQDVNDEDDERGPIPETIVH